MDVLTKPSWMQTFEKFLYGPGFFFFVAGMSILANVFSLEFFTYSVFVSIAAYLCLFGKDLLPVLPMASCCYIIPSRKNNPGLSDETMFSLEHGGIYMLVLTGILLVILTCRLIRDRELGRSAFSKCKRKLLPGMLILWVGYFLSGLGSAQLEKVWPQNLLFAAIQGIAIILPYYIISGLVKWEEAPENYLAWSGLCVGFVLLGELVNIYVQYDVIQEGISRQSIFSGWGQYNNIGSLLAMMIPFCFYLASNSKHPSVFYISAMLLFAGVILSCSRNSIVIALLIYPVAYILSLLHSKRARKNTAVHIFTVLAVIAIGLLFSDELLKLFGTVMSDNKIHTGREDIFQAGWQQFVNDPIFGATFYPADFPAWPWITAPDFSSFYPPRWHNTVIQLLASCGIMGLLAYSVHRIQTLVLFFRRPSGRKTFVFLSVLTLLLTSLLDCHFFNIGPVLFYSMALAFVEKRLDTQ